VTGDPIKYSFWKMVKAFEIFLVKEHDLRLLELAYLTGHVLWVVYKHKSLRKLPSIGPSD
jgi:hypothetical protein